MKAHARPMLALAAAALSIFLLEGCFGPFKKKSSGGGGGSETPTKQEASSGSGTAGGTAGTAGGTGAGTTTGDAGTGSGAGDTPYGPKDGYGCLQGVVVDGYTGQRIDLAAITPPNGVYVLIRDKKLMAHVVKDDPNLVGVYHICDIPVEEEYPIYAFLPGYLPFESKVKIDSTREVRVSGDQAISGEVKIPDPLVITNFRLFPLASSERGLTVSVVYNGAPQPGMTVDLEPIAGTGHWAWEGTFTASGDTVLLPLRAETDANGVATFEAAKLSLGVRYRLAVTASENSNLTSLTLGAATEFTFGINGSTFSADKNTYEKTVVLGEANGPIQLLTCSKEFQNYSPDGSIKYVFNRPVMVVNPDVMVATLAGSLSGAALADNVSGNAASEQVAVSPVPFTSGSRLTIYPKYKQAPKVPDFTKDINALENQDRDDVLTFDLATIHVRVVDDLDNNYTTLDALVKAAGLPASLAPCQSGAIRLYPTSF